MRMSAGFCLLFTPPILQSPCRYDCLTAWKRRSIEREAVVKFGWVAKYSAA